MEEKRLVEISKFLSKHLRHSPEKQGLTLAEGGWVRVDHLLAACARGRCAITLSQLEEVVKKNNKQRFSFSEDRMQIRANQGHSVEVDLQLEAITPPDLLYHGTAARTVDIIMREGLVRMNRHHVHLSLDHETAHRVGGRHGKPVVFHIDARAMSTDGHLFYVSDNGVWLTEHVPKQYLRILAP